MKIHMEKRHMGQCRENFDAFILGSVFYILCSYIIGESPVFPEMFLDVNVERVCAAAVPVCKNEEIWPHDTIQTLNMRRV